MDLTVVAGLAAFASRFVPLPLLDDLLRERVHRELVRRVLADASVDREILVALAGDSRSWASGCIRLALKLPLAILLFPVRKLANAVFAVRHLSRDLAEAYLLAKWVEYVVRHPLDSAAARRAKHAFDASFDATATTSLVPLFGPTSAGVSGVPGALRAGLALLWHGEATPTSGPAEPDAASATRRAFTEAFVEKCGRSMSEHPAR